MSQFSLVASGRHPLRHPQCMTLPAASVTLSNFGSMACDGLGIPAARGLYRRQPPSAGRAFCPDILPSFQTFISSTSAATWHKGWMLPGFPPPAQCTMPKARGIGSAESLWLRRSVWLLHRQRNGSPALLPPVLRQRDGAVHQPRPNWIYGRTKPLCLLRQQSDKQCRSQWVVL